MNILLLCLFIISGCATGKINIVKNYPDPPLPDIETIIITTCYSYGGSTIMIESMDQPDIKKMLDVPHNTIWQTLPGTYKISQMIPGSDDASKVEEAVIDAGKEEPLKNGAVYIPVEEALATLSAGRVYVVDIYKSSLILYDIGSITKKNIHYLIDSKHKIQCPATAHHNFLGKHLIGDEKEIPFNSKIFTE